MFHVYVYHNSIIIFEVYVYHISIIFDVHVYQCEIRYTCV